MGLGISVLDTGLSYVFAGLNFTRDLLTKIAGWIPGVDPNISVTIVFLLVSLWAGHFIAKKFVTRPLSGSYFLWYLIISISIFLNLTYL